MSNPIKGGVWFPTEIHHRQVMADWLQFFKIVISANTSNIVIANKLSAEQDWNGSSPVLVYMQVQSGKTVGSSSAGAPAITTGNLPLGSVVYLENRGTISGAGGTGGLGGNGTVAGVNGMGEGLPGTGGGTAIQLKVVSFIDNSGGIIQGGGGGGGGGGQYDNGSPAAPIPPASPPTSPPPAGPAPPSDSGPAPFPPIFTGDMGGTGNGGDAGSGGASDAGDGGGSE